MRSTTFLLFAVIASANAFGSSRYRSLISPQPNDSVEVAINDGGLGLPIRPGVLSDIHIDLNYHLARRVFNPTHLFSVLFICLVYAWSLPTVTFIINQYRCATPLYQEFAVEVRPLPGSRLLTTPIAGAVYDQMLAGLANSDLNPGLFLATLTTQDSPPIPIGHIWTSYETSIVPTKARHSIELESTPNASASVEDASNSTIMKLQPSPASNNHISATVRLNGRSTTYGPIQPKFWLKAFYHISKTLFRETSSDTAYRLNFPLAAVRFNVMRDYRLVSQVSSRPVPRGQSPLTWEELVAGIGRVLEKIIALQRFEAFEAEIFKDGWLAATYVLSQHPVVGLGEGDVETE